MKKEYEWLCSCGQIFSSRRKLQQHHKDCEIFLKRKGHNQFTRAEDLGLEKPKGTMTGKSSWKGKHHTEETKQKISESMKKVYEGKSIWYTQIEKRKSFAEQYFDACFPELEQNYHVDRYFLDLANPKLKLYVEIDGEQHYTDEKVIQHDKERTERLAELGWICVQRVRWSNYKKLSKKEQETLIESIRLRTVGVVD